MSAVGARRRRRAGVALLLAVVTGCAAAAPDTAGPLPQRVVSLDYCADQYVLRFVPARRIAALSVDAGAPYSYLRERARGLPVVHADAEAVLALDPDLVVRSHGGGVMAPGLYRRLGITLLQLGYPTTLTAVRDQVRRVADALGAAAAGAAEADRMQARLAALARPASNPVAVLYITAGGVTAGPGTLLDELIRQAGLTNRQTAPGWQALPLEALVRRPPALIATGFDPSTVADVHYWSSARSGIVRALLHAVPVVELDDATTSCAGWFALDTVERLHAAVSATDPGGAAIAPLSGAP